MLFDSLQIKIKTLPDDVIVYPGHGAGSACGKNIGSQSYSTIGEQRANNYAMVTNDRDTFINLVTADLPVIPGYFFTDAKINKTGYASFEEVLTKSLCPLSIDEVNILRKYGAVVLDTRDPQDFAAGFIKGSLNIGLNGDFAVWVGTFLDADTKIILITQPGKEKEAIERLARIGYENVQGYLDGGMNPWFSGKFDYGIVMTFTAQEVTQLMEAEEYNLLDVRNRVEVAKNRMVGSMHIPLNTLRDKYMELDKNKKWLIYCAGGYRSMIAASFLISRGFHFVASVEGGMKAIIQHAPELVEMDLDRSISE